MKQKVKHRFRFWIIAVILIILVLMVVAVIINLPKPQHVSDSSFDLSALADGIYQGECDNGLVFVRVEVEVQNQIISNIRILEHRNGMGQAAETIVNDVTRSQSLEVDAVSGATFSSQTILKAIENALSK